MLILGCFIIWGLMKWSTKRLKSKEEKKRRIIELELKAIRTQMNPHFLFNSLNSIQNLINKKEIKFANIYLTKFAELIRMILNNSEKQFITISEEIKAIRNYMELEKLRYNFDYEIYIDKNIEIYNIEVPAMLIQPFVENSNSSWD